MSMNPLAAVFDRLSGETTITDLLGLWRGDPAIISVSPVPEDVDGPFILLGEGTGEITPYQGITGLSQPIEVGCYSDNDESLYDMQALAQAVFALLHEAHYEEGNAYGVVGSKCSWPTRSTSGNGFQGYALTCTVQAFEEKGN